MKLQSIFTRFLKGFLAGGIGAVIALIQAGVQFSNANELKNLLISIITAFIIGGLMATEKWLNWKPDPQA